MIENLLVYIFNEHDKRKKRREEKKKNNIINYCSWIR